MPAGRPRKPTKLHILHGNPGRRPLNDDEPQPPDCIPEIPGHLDEEAQAEWHRITKQLLELGLITDVDRAALSAYCQAWSRWVFAETMLKKGLVIKAPSGYPIQSPFLPIANKALEQMLGYLTEFGLSPASRTRIKGSANPWKNEKPTGAKRFLA